MNGVHNRRLLGNAQHEYIFALVPSNYLVTSGVDQPLEQPLTSKKKLHAFRNVMRIG